jgi:catechol 2,3-dioxygenase-like lactoylglutathione lyase family enzyme
VDPVISEMLDHYEGGRLSRRELVAGLSALAAAGSAAPAAAQPGGPPPIPAKGLDHVSILVADLDRSFNFYNRVFGLVKVGEDAKNKIVRMAPAGAAGGPRGVGPVLVSLRQQQPYGTVDHWCFKVQGFKAETATEMLKAHGLTAANNVEYGFHIKDPDGVVVQMF